MGQIVTLNKPTGLAKFGGALAGIGKGLEGYADAQVLQEELQREREAHKLDVDAAIQAINQRRQRESRDAERFTMEQEAHGADMKLAERDIEGDIATQESYYRLNRAMRGDDDPEWHPPMLSPSTEADLEAATEMAKGLPAKEQPRFSAFLAEFLKERERKNQGAALVDTIKRASQPDPLTGEPALDEETALKLQGMLDAGEDPERVTKLTHEHLAAVKTERAEQMQYTGALTRMQQRYEQMQADPFADPDVLDAMADELAIMQVYKPTGAALRESERRFMASGRSKAAAPAKDDTAFKQEESDRKLRMDALKLAIDERNEIMKANAGIAEPSDRLPLPDVNARADEIYRQASGMSRTIQPEAVPQQPVPAPAATQAGPQVSEPDVAQRVLARFKELGIDPGTPVDQLTPEQKKALGLDGGGATKKRLGKPKERDQRGGGPF